MEGTLNGSLNMIGYGLAAIGPGVGIGLIFAAYINGVARQPEAQGRLQAIANLVHHDKAIVQRGRHAMRERWTVDELHHREGTAVVLAKIQNRHDVRVRHLSRDPGLLMHTRISSSPQANSDAPAYCFVERGIHGACCARTDTLDDRITPDARRMTAVVQKDRPAFAEAAARPAKV